MTPANRTPYLIDRTPRQILPRTSSQFHRLSSCLDLLPQGAWGTPGGQSPPGTRGATGEGLETAIQTVKVATSIGSVFSPLSRTLSFFL